VFRIEVFVDDKKLAAFLNAAAGLVASMSAPLPVVNMNKNMKAASNGNVPDTFHAELKKKKRTHFTIQDVKAFLEATGKSRGSYNYVIKHLKEQKLVKPTRNRGEYQVIK
jgi:hypothetical protein